MSKYLWPVTTTGLVLLMGVGLMMAPFGLHLRAPGGGWNSATYSMFWSGIGVLVVALVGLYAWVSGIGEEVQALLPKPAAAPAPEAPAVRERSAPTSDDPDQVLQQLARAVLRDLNQRLEESTPPGGGA
jgi:hypothetical protein